MLLVFYFHSVAANAVAPYFFGVSPNAAPIAHSPADVILINGLTGVTLFFVISGFIFTWGAFETSYLSWRRFYLNRILRIAPLYLLINLAAFLLPHGNMPLWQFGLNLIGFGNFHRGFGIYDTVLWTISLEIQFYLLFPLLMFWLKRRGEILLWALIGIMLITRLLVRLDGPYVHDLVYYGLFGRLDQFLAGMILAWQAKKRGWLSTDKTPRADLFGGLMFSVFALVTLEWIYLKTGWKYGESFFLVLWPTLEGLGWATVIGYYIRFIRQGSPKWTKPLQFVGVISFSLYILQYPLIKLLQQYGWQLNWPGHRLGSGLLSATFIALPIALIGATITYYLIEKPPLKLRRSYTTIGRAKLSKAWAVFNKPPRPDY